MILPTQPVKVEQTNPRKLFIFSQPKVGKTALVADLPNSLLIDLEDGSEFVEAAKINVQRVAIDEGKTILAVLKEISNALSKREHVYDYIILDTATALEDVALQLALINYKQSAIGKNFTGNDVLTLPNGAGYLWLRNAFEQIYEKFDKYAAKCFILTGHVKAASINKEGKDLNAKDIHLTGKLKQIVCSGMDAIGFLYRNKETNQNMLSFKTNEQDLATGARPPHLRGQEFVISELQGDNIITYWDKIFLK